MSSKPRLVILPNNCASKSPCALCCDIHQMPTPFAIFTGDDLWVCSSCAARELGPDAVAALDRLNREPEPQPATVDELPPEGRGWRMSCDRYAFSEKEVPFAGEELVRLTVRSGLDPDLARVIANELLRRYAEQRPDIAF